MQFKLRLAAMAMFALLLMPFMAPTAASAQVITCGDGDCTCCIIICGCSDVTCYSDSSEAGEASTEENEEAEQPTEEESVEENPAGDSNDLIRFSELLPNPIGKDADGEFIELANTGAADAEMSGWLIRNASGKEYALPSGLLAASGKLAIPYSESKISLTNGGMSLQLVGPDGSVQDLIEYPDEVDEGAAFAKAGDDWLWTTTPTPGFGNVITAEDDASADDSDTEESDENGAESNEEEDADDEPAEPAVPEVHISEIMPAPEGDDAIGEWIELYNHGSSDAILDDWSLDDAEGGSNPYELNGVTIPVGEYLLLTRPNTKLALNNGADEVRLIDADGALVDFLSYDGAQEGEALAHHADGWLWTTTPTPGDTNIFTGDTSDSNDVESEEGTNDDADDSADAEQNVLTIEQVHEVPDETRVTVTGVVTMPLGVVGTTIFGVRDTDAEYGATVRIYASDRPDLQVGDIVQVDGTVRRKDSGELRLDTFGSHPVTITGSMEVIETPEVRIEDLDGTSAGLAVTVTGTVTDMGSDWFVITDNDAQREIKVELPTGSAVPVESGDTVTINGIVRVQRSVIALAVLDNEDVEANESAMTDAEYDDSLTVDDEGEDGNMALPFLVVGALGAGGVAYRGFKSKKNLKRA